MDEETKMIAEIIQEFGIRDVVPEIYKDLLQPTVKETGKNLLNVAKAISVALSPLKGAIWGFEKIEEWVSVKLTEKLSKTASEKFFVGLELTSAFSPYSRPGLFYWHRDARSSNAEIDYVLSRDTRILPIEVKTGTRGQMQSLHLHPEPSNPF